MFEECLCTTCTLKREESDRDGKSVRHFYHKYEMYLESIGFTYLDCGSFRKGYARKDVVIKVPYFGDGIIDNRVEAAAWNKYKNGPTDLGLYLAPCRLLSNLCLMMVKISPYDWRNAPAWTDTVDSCQVGMFRGRPVAYDYALNVTERYAWEKKWQTRSVFFHDMWITKRPHLIKEEAA